MKCIFCGKEASKKEEKDSYIRCHFCGAEGPSHAKIEDAEKEWFHVLCAVEMQDELSWSVERLLGLLIEELPSESHDSEVKAIFDDCFATLKKARGEEIKS